MSELPKVARIRTVAPVLIAHSALAWAALNLDPGFWYLFAPLALFACGVLTIVLSTEVDDSGISQVRLWRRVRMRWSEVESVKFEGQAIQLRSKGRLIVVLPMFFQNEPFASAFLASKLRTDMSETP